jgi:hypothetical protein
MSQPSFMYRKGGEVSWTGRSECAVKRLQIYRIPDDGVVDASFTSV